MVPPPSIRIGWRVWSWIQDLFGCACNLSMKGKKNKLLAKFKKKKTFANVENRIPSFVFMYYKLLTHDDIQCYINMLGAVITCVLLFCMASMVHPLCYLD